MTSSIVFVPQVPTGTRDGYVQPSMDLSPAEEFGRLQIILSETHNPLADPQTTAQIVEDLLHAFKPTRSDWLLLVGNPILIGITTTLFARHTGGHLRLLQWNRGRRCYLPVELSLERQSSGLVRGDDAA